MERPSQDEYKYRDKKYRTYPLYYALKYKLDIINIPHTQIIEKIYRYEMDNVNELLRNGADKNTKEYGYFLL